MITEQSNKAIAEFYGCTKSFDTYFDPVGKYHFEIHEAQYHTSWDWLRPVIDKIFNYALAYPEQVRKVIDMKIVVNIDAAHEAVVKFILWYSTQNH